MVFGDIEFCIDFGEDSALVVDVGDPGGENP
jgi:hypothetical protein